MWLIALRDLQFRRRRFSISVVAVALVFAMTLVLSGLATSFDREVDRAMAALGADAYIVGANATGPFMGAAPIPETMVGQVATLPGITQADPIAFRNLTVDNPRQEGVNVFGIRPGGLGTPQLLEGRGIDGHGQAVIDERLGYALGETFTMGGSTFTVVGRTTDQTLLGGGPIVVVGLADLQAIGFGTAKVISSVAVRGSTGAPPQGTKVQTPEVARGDLTRPLQPARDAITFVSVLLWAVAVCIIGSVIYLSALERMRDFAVLKATGTASRSLLGGLVVQALLLSVVAALIATAVAIVLAPRFPVPMTIPPESMLVLPLAAAGAGALASAAGVRRAVTVEPALAFGGP